MHAISWLCATIAIAICIVNYMHLLADSYNTGINKTEMKNETT